jgi:excisionase family DNA binding protein
VPKLAGYLDRAVTDPERLDEWLTPREVADLLAVTVGTVRKWIHAGKLPASRTPGGRFRIRVEDLDLEPARDPPRPVPGPETSRSNISKMLIARMIRDESGHGAE